MPNDFLFMANHSTWPQINQLAPIPSTVRETTRKYLNAARFPFAWAH